MKSHVNVETQGGWVRGIQDDGAFSFKGVPYGADTGGAARFMPPKPTHWSGVREAFTFGPRAFQNEAKSDSPQGSWLRDDSPESENCLVLNVFTAALDEQSRLPVMVYLHGGGFATGGSGAAGLDGGNLARRGAVVVTLNHRLNLFGHLWLGGSGDEQYADSGNAGMLDIVAALEWVRGNISRFGGDPGNVTLFGQSGGGSKVAVLMAMPRAQGLFHRAIVQSASSLLRVATLEDAERSTHHLLATLGLTHAQVHKLKEVPAEALLRAMPAAIRSAASTDNFRPLVDGRSLLDQPFGAASLHVSGHVPLLAGWCEDEQRLKLVSRSRPGEQSEAEASAGVAQALDFSPEEAAALLQTYRRSRPTATPDDLYARIVGDQRYRRNITRAVELRVRDRSSPTWLYMLRWKSPVLDGLLGTPHTMCLPFVFDNVEVAAALTGVGPQQDEIARQMSTTWLAFARTGTPDNEAIPAWPRYSLASRSTMVFDARPVVMDDPLREERLALEPMPLYVPSAAEGRMALARVPAG